MISPVKRSRSIICVAEPSNRAKATQGLVYTNKDSVQLIRTVRTGSLRASFKYEDAPQGWRRAEGRGATPHMARPLTLDGRRDAAVLQISAITGPKRCLPLE